MRTRLFEATLTCLEKWGYHGTSLTRILDTAGVSRGAWRHHFATKHDLVAAAAEYALTRAVATTQALARQAPSGQLDLERLFDFIWNNFYTGRHRAVWLEFNVACRTDTALRQRLTPVLENFHASIEKAWKDYYATTARTDISIEVFLVLTINALRGMAVQSIVQDDQAYYKKLRAHWISILAPLIQKKAGNRAAEQASST
jgi:AcrR family transcriptional regulator